MVLLGVSERLQNIFAENVSLSRLGGDEFIVVVPYISSYKSVIESKAIDYKKKLMEIFEAPFIVNDLHLRMSSSVGILIVEPQYTNIEEIVRHADIAMYQAKNTNKKNAYYDESLDRKQQDVFELQNELAYAVKNKQLEMYYQPIMSLEKQKVYSTESLIRWNHPTRGLLMPDTFIPLSLQVGILSEVTWWVIDTVCKKIASWKEEDL